MELIGTTYLQIKCTVQHCHIDQEKINTNFTLTISIDLPTILEQMTMRRSANPQNVPKFFSKLKLQSKYFHSKFKVTRDMIKQFALDRGHAFKFVTQGSHIIQVPPFPGILYSNYKLIIHAVIVKCVESLIVPKMSGSRPSQVLDGESTMGNSLDQCSTLEPLRYLYW